MTLWSYDELTRLKAMARRQQAPDTMARATGHTLREVDVAKWNLLGRTISETCDALNGPVLARRGVA